MQEEILEANPSADVRVYAIWLPMRPGDNPGRWDGADLSDPRVVHVWDRNRVTGDWFAANVSGSPGTEWDAYFLYGPDATWDREPGPLVSWGRTVIAARGRLRAGIVPLLGR